MASNGSPSPATKLDWRELLRHERQRLGLSQVRVAEIAGISPETLRKYESGGRTPNRATLDRVIGALQLSQAKARAILSAAGFASVETLFDVETYPDYFFSHDDVQPYLDSIPWPCFVANNLTEVIAVNRAAEALWEIDFAAERERRSRAQINFLSIAAERRFSERIVNWEELVGALIGVLKAVPESATMLDQPGVLFGDVLEEYMANDPGLIVRLFKLWTATPARTPKVRWNYPVVWRAPGIGDMRFLGVVTVASHPDALGFNDWIPQDAETFERLMRTTAKGGVVALAAPESVRDRSVANVPK